MNKLKLIIDAARNDDMERVIKLLEEALAECSNHESELMMDDGNYCRKILAEPDIEEMTLTQIAARHEQAEQEQFDMNDHPPHRLCECRKCMEYFTPLPDCDAFAGGGKPIAEQKPVAVVEITYGREPECYVTGNIDDFPEGVFKLYAAPVRTKDLTDEEIVSVLEYYDHEWDETTFAIARAVIAADREKNK